MMNRYEEQMIARSKAMRRAIVAAVIGVLVAVIVTSSVGSVQHNHSGILIRAGVVQERELSEGWKLKIPFVDRIVTMSNMVLTTRIAAGTDKPTTTETAETKDRQLIPVYEFEIQHQLSKDQSFSVYKNYGTNYETQLIISNGVSIIKQVFGLFDAEDIINHKSEIPEMIAERLNAITAPVGVEIRRVNMKTYDFTEEYTAILEERAMLAAQLTNNEIKQNNERIAAQTAYDVAVKKAEQDAETARIAAENEKEVALVRAAQDKETALIRANTQAEAKKIEADNQAYVTMTLADADRDARLAAAEATKAELEAQAAGLNNMVIQKLFLEKWNGQLLPNFGNGAGFTFADMTDIIKQYLPAVNVE